MRNHFFVSTALLTGLIFSSGCQNAGPRTQEGAVNGAALGALGGAIVGNNSRGGNGASGALVGAIAGAILGGAIGNESDQREADMRELRNERSTSTLVVAEAPQPPAKPSEIIPRRPSQEAVWVGGFWIYNSNHRYEWEPGRWEIPPAGCSDFVPPHWARQGNGYVYMSGYWRP